MTTVGVNDFCKGRHGPNSEFTAFLVTDEEGEPRWDFLVELVQSAWELRRPGYREGVVLVPIAVSEGGNHFFTTPVVTLNEHDLFEVVYKPRREGELPRKSTKVSRVNALGEERGPSPAQYVDVVLYRREVLAEKDEDRTGLDWDIITVLGKLSAEDQPMNPGTLMANHFDLDGGSNTNMSPGEFEVQLRRCVLFWNDKGMLAAPKVETESE